MVYTWCKSGIHVVYTLNTYFTRDVDISDGYEEFCSADMSLSNSAMKGQLSFLQRFKND